MQKMSCESVCRGFLLRHQSFRSRNIALAMDNSISWFRNRSRSLSVSSKEESLDISLSDYEAFRRSLCGGSLKYKASLMLLALSSSLLNLLLRYLERINFACLFSSSASSQNLLLLMHIYLNSSTPL